MEGVVCRSSTIRAPAAEHLGSSAKNQPVMRIGKYSTTRYCVNASRSPMVMSPFATRIPPSHSAPRVIRVGTSSNQGRYRARKRARPIDLEKMSSATRSARRASRSSLPNALVTAIPEIPSWASLLISASACWTWNEMPVVLRAYRIAKPTITGRVRVATRPITGSRTKAMTATMMTVMMLARVIGRIMYTSRTWVRSVEARAISDPAEEWS